MPGTAQWAVLHQQYFDELTVTAERAGDWGFVGALCIANNFVADADARILASWRFSTAPYWSCATTVSRLQLFRRMRGAGGRRFTEPRDCPPLRGQAHSRTLLFRLEEKCQSRPISQRGSRAAWPNPTRVLIRT
jgi:hypothetical protein